MKLNNVRRFWQQSFFVVVLFFFMSYSGNVSLGKSLDQLDEWTLLAEKDGIKVSYKFQQCEDRPRILFLIQNTTSSTAVVDFECNITLAEDGIIIPSFRNTLYGKSSLEGSCSDRPSQSTFLSLPEHSSFKAITITLK